VVSGVGFISKGETGSVPREFGGVFGHTAFIATGGDLGKVFVALERMACFAEREILISLTEVFSIVSIGGAE